MLAATVPAQSVKLFDAFYRAGSLVFGVSKAEPTIETFPMPVAWVRTTRTTGKPRPVRRSP